MTTIAVRNGIMVATGATWTSIYRGQRPKIMRTREGALTASCGDSDMALPFFNWLDAGADQKNLPRTPDKSDFAAMVLYPDGSVSVFTERFLKQDAAADFYALGSGEQFALGAMGVGASAEEAVQVACYFDPWSRGPLQVVALR
jgi:hypothetical protein